MVTGGLRLGQTGDQLGAAGHTGGPRDQLGHTGGPRDQTRGQVRPGQTKMPADGLTSSISRFDFVYNEENMLYLPFPQFLEKN